MGPAIVRQYMNLEDFLEGTIFIDANIFIYSITSAQNNNRCNNFLNKLKFGEIKGIINPIIISEVYHKLLVLNISKNYKTSYEESIRLIKSNPEILEITNGPKEAIIEMSKFG